MTNRRQSDREMRVALGFVFALLLVIFSTSAKLAMYHHDDAVKSLTATKVQQSDTISNLIAPAREIVYPAVLLATVLAFLACLHGIRFERDRPLPLSQPWSSPPGFRRPPPNL
jgi:hypothetical protein